MIRTHKVYIVEQHGGAPLQREVIFPEDLEGGIREYLVELTLCRETFREEAKKLRKQGSLVDAEINFARAERIDDLLRRSQSPVSGSSLLSEPDQFNLADLNGKSTEEGEIPLNREWEG